MTKAKGKAKGKATAKPMTDAELAGAVAPLVDEVGQPVELPTSELPGRDSQAGLVACRLGPAAPVGALVVGNASIERNRPGRIPRPEFERLKREYDLIEVEE